MEKEHGKLYKHWKGTGLVALHVKPPLGMPAFYIILEGSASDPVEGNVSEKQ